MNWLTLFWSATFGDAAQQALRERLSEQEYQIALLKKRIAWHEEGVEAIEIQKERLKEEANALEKRESNLNALHSQIRAENDSLNQGKLDLAKQQAAYQVLQKELMDKEQAIANLKMAIQSQTEENIKRLEQEYKAGFDWGKFEATSEWSVENEKLRLQVERLKVQLGEAQTQEGLEKRLPELVDVLKNERKPFLIVGNQGSGKALTASTIAQFYAGEAGLLPFALDICEGGCSESKWHKLGIPSTADARLFLHWMQSVVGQLDPDKNGLPFRNDRAAYDGAPAIVAILNEPVACTESLDRREYEEFVNCLKAFETRGNKRKFFLGILTQNESVYNLNGLTNSGRLSNYYKIFLNEGLLSKCSKELLDNSSDLREYIEADRENYKCGVIVNSAYGEVIKPCKHPLHRGSKSSEMIPVKVPEINRYTPYDWFPLEVQELFNKEGRGQRAEGRRFFT